MTTPDLYLAALCAVVPGLGRRSIPKLINYFGSAEAVYTASEKELEAARVTPVALANFVKNRSEHLPEKLDYFCRQNGVRLLTITGEDYQERLRKLSDPPLVLYVKGELPTASYNVAVVGSRAASPYGIKAASYFAGALAQAGIPIISGGARGIDAAAHEAALAAGGTTVAVMGCGLDQVYPPSNRQLFARIAEQGALVSEFAPGMPPLAPNFPARNRIVVGLSEAVLVAEAAQRSGALITANIAADEGREVFCVPGNIFDRTSIGCHDLIRTGARLVDAPQDILEERNNYLLACERAVLQPSIFAFDNNELDSSTQSGALKLMSNLTSNKKESLSVGAAAATPNEAVATPTVTKKLSELSGRIIKLLGKGALSMEELLAQTGVSFSELSMELLDLQVAGLVTQDQAQRYCRH